MAEEPRVVSIDELLAHAVWVRSLARDLVVDESRADDVVQETWLAALGRPPQRRDAMRAWLRSVMGNFARMRHREDRRRRTREERSASPEAVPSEAALLERVEMQRAIADAVVALDEPYRHVVLLRFFHDLGPREIARTLGVPEATVKTRLRRALEQLRAALGARFGDRAHWAVALIPLALLADCAPPVISVSASSSLAGGALKVGGVIVSAKKVIIAVAGVVLLLCAVPLVNGTRDSRHDKSATSRGTGATSIAAAPATTTVTPSATAPERIAPAGPETGFSGHVWLERAGQPAAGATVLVWRSSGQWSDYDEPLRTVYADPDGGYRVTGLAPGEYSRHAFGSSCEWAGGEWNVMVKEDLMTEGCDFVVVPGVMLTGVVHDTSDAKVPIAGACVVLDNGRKTTTDDNGSYSFDGVLLEECSVLAHADAYVPRILRPTGNGTRNVQLDFALERGAVIEGRVTDEAGQPIAGAQAGSPLSGSMFQVRAWYVTADSDGRFCARFVAPGEDLDRVQVSADGYARRTLKDASWPPGGEPLVVDVVLERGVTISGRVLSGDRPVQDAVAWVGWGGNTVHTDEDGYFEVTGVSRADVAHNGLVIVGVTKEGFCPQVTNWGWESAIMGTHTYQLEAGVPVEGWVRDESGAGIPGVRLFPYLWNSSIPDSSFETGHDGHFVIPHLPEGEGWVSIHAYKPGYTRGNLERIKIPPEEPLLVCLTRITPFAITGVVVDADSGEPVPAFSVQLQYGETHTVQSPQGTFRIDGVDSGTRQRVIFNADGYIARVVPDVEAKPEELADSADWVVALERGRPLTGRVVRADDGAPIPAAHVTLVDWLGPARRSWPRDFRDEALARSAETDSKGSFVFPAVEAKPLGLAVYSPGYGRVRIPRVAAAESPLVVRLAPAAIVRGNLSALAAQYSDPLHLNVDGDFNHWNVTPDTKGDYRIDDLGAGTIEVSVVAGNGYVRTARVVLAAGEEVVLNFAGDTGLAISGQVFFGDEPAAGAEIYMETDGCNASVKADNAGKFRAGDLSPGRYAVHAHHYFRPEEEGPGLRGDAYATVVLENEPVSVRLDCATAWIAGVVKPAPGDWKTSVELFGWLEPGSPADFERKLSVDGWVRRHVSVAMPDGRFRVGCVPAGRYLLRAGNAVLGPFDLAAGEVRNDVVLRDEPSREIALALMDESGARPLRAALVELCTSEGAVLVTGETDDNGSWTGTAPLACTLLRMTPWNRRTIERALPDGIDAVDLRVTYPPGPRVRVRLTGPGRATLGTHPMLRLVAEQPLPYARANERGREFLACFNEAGATEVVLGQLPSGTLPAHIELYKNMSEPDLSNDPSSYCAPNATFDVVVHVPDEGETVVELRVPD